MSHGPEQHIEHAEHASHASHSRFDRQVTISIAIVAAVLACITMLGHRAHNDTLRLQGEALRYQLDSSVEHARSVNTWTRYQAVNIRSHYYQTELEASEFSPVISGKEGKSDAARKRWQGQVDKYEKKQMPELEGQAREFTEKSDENAKKAKELLDHSHEVHAKADRFDYGELGLQLGVVLCSLAILTKGRPFWVLGLVSSVAGLAIALTGVFGLFLGGHH